MELQKKKIFMNIYLDIDGVLLTKESKPAKHVFDFLVYITNNHQVYWLTTHCRGEVQAPIQYLKDKLSEDTLPFLEKIKPTIWQTLKTEAIDFSKDFLWFDDYIMQAEKKVLEKNNAAEKIVIIDLKSNPNILTHFQGEFQQSP
jgi:hypothetical protein